MKFPEAGLTPAEFYKMRRPEFFSDSKIIYEVLLTREQLAFELDQISKNQKQDDFEVFCRRLAERFITPNLIPQVGPTGGGDSKVDSETYPVSMEISNRWFVPQNGWDKDEKWAFAISAKEDWVSKVRIDVDKITKTGRGYTQIYFITNQTPSSKKKVETQEKLKSEFGIEITILDGEWILEKVFNNDLVDLTVDSLNLSDIYKRKNRSVGQKDAHRIEKLAELEDKISTPGRYSEFDFQIVEDCLEAAVLSRMLEKPRDEVDGKFERTVRFCKKVNNHKQWLRVHYQKAWTNLNWYDDYSGFIAEFKDFKSYISNSSTASDLELYVNLFNLLRGLSNSGKCDLSALGISFEDEENMLISALSELEKDAEKLCSSLIAKTYKSILALMNSLPTKAESESHLSDLSKHLDSSRGFIEFPFERFKDIIEVFGDIFPNSIEFDRLVDTIGSISEERSSQLASGETFLKRGIQKLEANFYKESIVYFGKAVLKLAKEESDDGMYISLIGLSQAYSSLGLVWASNNCLVSAGNISLGLWRQKGVIDKRTYYCAKQLAINEILIGRIPSFLAYHELAQVVANSLNLEESKEDFNLTDAFLAIRILDTDSKHDKSISTLPEILKKHSLWLSEDSCYYKLGYTELIENLFSGLDIRNEIEIDKHFNLLYNQPFRGQLLYETNFLDNENITMSSTILGCKFNLHFKAEKELHITAEIFLAFFEAFFATSLDNVFPSVEAIEIEIIKNTNTKIFLFSPKGTSTNEYELSINKCDFSIEERENFWLAVWGFTSLLISRNLYIKDFHLHLENLFKKEEIIERLTLIFEYRKFINNFLGSKSASVLHDWNDTKKKTFPNKRLKPILFEDKNESDVSIKHEEGSFSSIGHDKRRVFSVIETSLWDNAKWRGFGSFGDSSGLVIFIAYENIDYGKQIFDNWIKRFGNEDNEEIIRIAIIKGVNANYPNWYKVHISSKLGLDDFESAKFILSASRFHEINADNSTNLRNLIEGFNYFRKFRFCPAKLLANGGIEPYLDRSILKKELVQRNAWELGVNDLDGVVIMAGDKPIIPSNVTNAPVLELLKHKPKSSRN